MKKWEAPIVQHLALNQTQLDGSLEEAVYKCCSCRTSFNSQGQGIEFPYTIIKPGSSSQSNINSWKCSNSQCLKGSIIQIGVGQCS